MNAPKTEFVAELARLTDADLAFTRQRIRSQFQAGLGPHHNQPLTFSEMADFLIGFIAAPTHGKAGAIVKRYRKFRCVRIEARQPDKTAVAAAFLQEKVPRLRPVLTAILRARAEESPIRLLNISALWPPYCAVIVRLLPGGGGGPVAIHFGQRPAVVAQLKDLRAWPVRHEATLDGHVIDGLARIAVPDEPLSKDW